MVRILSWAVRSDVTPGAVRSGVIPPPNPTPLHVPAENGKSIARSVDYPVVVLWVLRTFDSPRFVPVFPRGPYLYSPEICLYLCQPRGQYYCSPGGLYLCSSDVCTCDFPRSVTLEVCTCVPLEVRTCVRIEVL